MTSATTKKILLALLILSFMLVTGCRASSTASIPSDFLFIMDVKSAGEFDGCVHVNIKIEANGKGRYETYNTGCAIEYDSSHMVTYQRGQIIEKGQFRFSDTELEGLWHTINENNFFNLTEDYRMAIGSSYAFIVIEADGQRYMVDNIGMEVLEVRAIVEATASIMPEGVELDYGEGFPP